MKKKILVVGVLGIFLLASLTVSGVEFTANKVETDDYENVLPVMRADNNFLNMFAEDYYSEEVAYIDPSLTEEIQGTEDFSILDLLEYDPVTRTQGGCPNCWAWPSTAVLAIALRVQEGVEHNRLSVQYMNSCGELYPFTQVKCCEGGTISMLASFYRETDIAIPWSNENAEWQDHVILRQCEMVSCEEIAKFPNFPIEYIRSARITTRGVTEGEAIYNIKNILHQNRGVYFSVFYAADEDLQGFRDHWADEGEQDVYDLDWYTGEWNSDEAVGHAMLVVGYHDEEDSDANDYWIVLNSWGTTNQRPNGLLLWDMHMDYSKQFSNNYAFGVETLNVTFGSNSPTTSITGPTSGRPNTEYTYDVKAVDPQGDDVYIYVSWGVGEGNTDWIGPYASGEVVQLSHTWEEEEEYKIQAKAKDINDNVGEEQPLKITISKSRIINRPLLNLLMNYITQLKIINILLQYI